MGEVGLQERQEPLRHTFTTSWEIQTGLKLSHETRTSLSLLSLSHIPKDRVSVFLQQNSWKAPSRVRVDSEGYLLIISAFQILSSNPVWVTYKNN